MKWKVPLFKIHTEPSDVRRVTDVINRGSFWADGPEVKEFEEKIAEYMGVKYALTYNSGTSALHALLLAYDVKDKEVIVPSMTFISTATAVLMAGGIPVFAESESETLGLKTSDVEKRITGKTVAVIALHYGGIPAKEIIDLKSLCEKKGIVLIEDNAESMGASVKGKKVGTFGDGAMLSFCQSKIVATGEGGAIITNNKMLYEKMKLIRSHGRVEEQEDYFSSIEDNDYISIGYNWRMPTMVAALGCSQLEHVDEVIKLRREKADVYKSSLSGLPITYPKEEDALSVYQLFTIILEDKKIRDGLQNYLEKNAIMSKVYFQPSHLKTIYKDRKYEVGDLPETENLSGRVLSLPFHPDLTLKEIELVTGVIKDFFLLEDRK